MAKGAVAKIIRKLFAKFEWTGSVADDLVWHIGSRLAVVTPENVATVSVIVH